MSTRAGSPPSPHPVAVAHPAQGPAAALLAHRVAHQRAGGHGAVSAANVLFLPIFLVLLVFFILLVAQSKPKSERVAAVKASVEKHFPAFVIDRRLQGGDAALASRSGTVFAAERLNTMGDLFATAIAVARVTTVTPGRLMEVRLPADSLFVPGTTTLRAERQALLDRVVNALREDFAGQRLEVEALLAIDDQSLSQRPGPVQRAAAIARGLADLGAPLRSISAGVERGDPGSARLLFSVHDIPAAPAAGTPPTGTPQPGGRR